MFELVSKCKSCNSHHILSIVALKRSVCLVFFGGNKPKIFRISGRNPISKVDLTFVENQRFKSVYLYSDHDFPKDQSNVLVLPQEDRKSSLVSFHICLYVCSTVHGLLSKVRLREAAVNCLTLLGDLTPSSLVGEIQSANTPSVTHGYFQDSINRWNQKRQGFTRSWFSPWPARVDAFPQLGIVIA